jgi:hypothetical protein
MHVSSVGNSRIKLWRFRKNPEESLAGTAFIESIATQGGLSTSLEASYNDPPYTSVTDSVSAPPLTVSNHLPVLRYVYTYRSFGHRGKREFEFRRQSRSGNRCLPAALNHRLPWGG